MKSLFSLSIILNYLLFLFEINPIATAQHNIIPVNAVVTDPQPPSTFASVASEEVLSEDESCELSEVLSSEDESSDPPEELLSDDESSGSGNFSATCTL